MNIDFPGTVPAEDAAPIAPLTPNLFGAATPEQVVVEATAIATTLAKILRDRNHVVRIGGGEHVKLEGWTTLGSMLGVFAVTGEITQLDDGWMASAEARTLTGQVVGAATAVCLRSEKQWSSRPDYALLSMAQTRACSKALRLPLGFIIELAGYEATPADEMPIQPSSSSSGGGPSASYPPPEEGSVGERPSGRRTPASGGPPLLPPTPVAKITDGLMMKPDDRMDDGAFPTLCPYCLSDVISETRLIKRGTPNERNQAFTNCSNAECTGGREYSGRRYPWSEFGSPDSVFRVGGPVDELVNADHGPVEDDTPTYDATAHLRKAMQPANRWTDAEKKERLAVAKAAVAPRRVWSPEVTTKVIAHALAAYFDEFGDDSGAPF